MTVDLAFLKDVEALAQFVACLKIDNDLRARAERVKCDCHDLKREIEAKEEKRVRRDSVRLKAYAEAR